MAFLLYKEGKLLNVSDDLLKEYKQPPLFLVPDITAEPTVYNSLLFNLSQKLPNQLFLVWKDPRITEKGPIKENSIEQQGEQIAAEVEKTMSVFTKNSPIRMIGYSFGCLIGAEALQILKRKKSTQEVFLFNIDSPTRIYSSQHLGKPEATEDFILLAQTAAKLAGFPITQLNVDEKLKTQWNNLPIDRRIKAIQIQMFDAQPDLCPTVVAAFYRYGNLIKNNILKLQDHSTAKITELDYIQAVFTSKTLAKHQCKQKDGGWSKYALQVDTQDVTGNHFTVLSEVPKELTTLIQTFSAHQISPKFKRQASKPIQIESKSIGPAVAPVNSIASLFNNRTPSPYSVSSGSSPTSHSDPDSGDETSSLSSQDEETSARRIRFTGRTALRA